MNMAISDTSAQDRSISRSSIRKRLATRVAVVVVALLALVYAASYVVHIAGSDLVVTRSDIRTAVVHRGELVREVVSQGRVVAASSPTMFSSEAGYVSLEVDPGDTVTEGQVLARVTSPDLNELLARETANLTRMQAELGRQRIESRRHQLEMAQAVALAEVNLQAMERENRRAAKAWQRQIINEFEYEQAQDDVDRARLEIEQAKQNDALARESQDFEIKALELQLKSQQLLVDSLERRVNDLTIRSPVAGMVGNVQVTEGQAVAASQPLITVVDLTAFEVEASVSEGFADELAPLMQAEIKLGNQEYAGRLTAISPEVVNGTVVTRIGFDGDPPEGLRQNQRVTARIVLEHKPNTLIVNRGSFFDSFRGDVFKVQADKAVRTPVVLGGRSLRHVEIREGLNEGDEVIISNLVVDRTEQQILISN